MSEETMRAKVLLLGDGAVGKTSLVRRFVVDHFSDDYITTIGTKVTKKEVSVGTPPEATDVIMQIWDVLGQKGYGSVQETAVKGARAVMFVYDVTRPETVRSLEDHWVPMVWRLVGRIPLVFAGNKADLLDYRSHAREVLGYLEQKFDGSGFLTSAKTGEQVEETFERLAARIVGYRGRPPERVAVVTPPQDEVDRLVVVADRIMTDFCAQIGSADAGMPVVKTQFEKAGVDVRVPREDALRRAIDRLAHVEGDFKSPEQIAVNRARRLAWLEGRDFI